MMSHLVALFRGITLLLPLGVTHGDLTSRNAPLENDWVHAVWRKWIGVILLGTQGL